MKARFSSWMGTVVAVGSIIISIFDILEPIFSVGLYAALLLGAVTSYLAWLSFHYKTAEHLTLHRKAFAHRYPLSNFYRKHWVSEAIWTFIVLTVIASVGTAVTSQNRAAGGFYASLFPIVKEMQSSMNQLLRGQEEIKGAIIDVGNKADEIKADTADIKDSISNIEGTVATITFTDLAERVRESPRPFLELKLLFEGRNIEYDYSEEDLLYVSEVFKLRKSYLPTLLLQSFFDTCQEKSFSEKNILTFLSNVSQSIQVDYRNYVTDHYDTILFCLDGRPTEKLARYFLFDSENNLIPAYFNNKANEQRMLNVCEVPIDDSFFLSSDIPNNLMGGLVQELLKSIRKYSPSCISSSSATIINEQFNTSRFLSNGWYMEQFHIFSNKCLPVVTRADLEMLHSTGIRVNEHVLQFAQETGCVE